MSKDAIDFSISRELAEKFNMALKLNQENSKEVLTKFINNMYLKLFLEYHKRLLRLQNLKKHRLRRLY